MRVDLHPAERRDAKTVYRATLALATGDTLDVVAVVTDDTATAARVQGPAFVRSVKAWLASYGPAAATIKHDWADTPAGRAVLAILMAVASSPVVNVPEGPAAMRRNLEGEKLNATVNDPNYSDPEVDAIRGAIKIGKFKNASEAIAMLRRNAHTCHDSRCVLSALYSLGRCCDDCSVNPAYVYDLGKVLSAMPDCAAVDEIIYGCSDQLCHRAMKWLSGGKE